jgi:hypothetical protein
MEAPVGSAWGNSRNVTFLRFGEEISGGDALSLSCFMSFGSGSTFLLACGSMIVSFD